MGLRSACFVCVVCALSASACDWRELTIDPPADGGGGSGGRGGGPLGGGGTAGDGGVGGEGSCEKCGGEACVDLMTDESHCGVCNFACWDTTEGRCQAGTCRIYAPTATIHALAYDAGKLYWDDGAGHLLRSGGPGEIEELSQSDTGLQTVIDLQVGGGYIYASHSDNIDTLYPMKRLDWSPPHDDHLDVTWADGDAGALQISLQAALNPPAIVWTAPTGGFYRELAQIENTALGPVELTPTFAAAIRLQTIAYSFLDLQADPSAVFKIGLVNGAIHGPRPDSFAIGSDGEVYWASAGDEGELGCATVEGEVLQYAPDASKGPVYVSEGVGEAVYVAVADGSIWAGELGCPAPVQPWKISEAEDCPVVDFASDGDGTTIFFARTPGGGETACAGVFMRSSTAPPLGG